MLQRLPLGSDFSSQCQILKALCFSFSSSALPGEEKLYVTFEMAEPLKLTPHT